VNLYSFYGDKFKVECPTGSGRYMTLFEVANQIEKRPASTFLRDGKGRLPVTEGPRSSRKIRTGATSYSPNEYFHGDNGSGLGASHQIASGNLLRWFASRWAAKALELRPGGSPRSSSKPCYENSDIEACVHRVE
jgi:hypothetical protein